MDAALALGEIPNQEGRRRWRDVAVRKRVLDRLPVWVAAGVADEAALTAALAGARAMLLAATEGAVSWGPGAPYRGVATTEVRETLTEAAEAQVGLVFAVVGKTWVVSLDRGALEEVIDAVLAGRLPGGAGVEHGGEAGVGGAQRKAGAGPRGASRGQGGGDGG
ncbi:MAG: hypothetical protein R3F65_03245 [bacterium]